MLHEVLRSAAFWFELGDGMQALAAVTRFMHMGKRVPPARGAVRQGSNLLASTRIKATATSSGRERRACLRRHIRAERLREEASPTRRTIVHTGGIVWTRWSAVQGCCRIIKPLTGVLDLELSSFRSNPAPKTCIGKCDGGALQHVK